ncbi:MAG: HTH domain-containing protein [Candidatus Aenigmatarchaeota archaeon]
MPFFNILKGLFPKRIVREEPKEVKKSERTLILEMLKQQNDLIINDLKPAISNFNQTVTYLSSGLLNLETRINRDYTILLNRLNDIEKSISEDRRMFVEKLDFIVSNLEKVPAVKEVKEEIVRIIGNVRWTEKLSLAYDTIRLEETITPSKLAEKLNVTPSTAQNYINRLFNLGFLKEVGNGVYKPISKSESSIIQFMKSQESNEKKEKLLQDSSDNFQASIDDLSNPTEDKK